VLAFIVGLLDGAVPGATRIPLVYVLPQNV